MRVFPTASVGAAVLSLLSAGCEAPDPAGNERIDLGPLEVVGITLLSINEHYPERPPGSPLNRFVCQVEMDVVVVLPDGCSGLGAHTGPDIQGNTIRFTIRGERRRASGYCGGPVVDTFGLCLPGLGADPPPPALPPGHYVVIVNNFTGGFDIP